jgi:hypothetical protein
MAIFKRVDYTFASLSDTCATALFLPTTTPGPWPAVIAGPGFADMKEMLIPSYARSLAFRQRRLLKHRLYRLWCLGWLCTTRYLTF